MKIRKNGKVINLTESDLKRIVKRVIMEEDNTGLKITKAVFDDYGEGQTKTKGSYVVLSDGETYRFKDDEIGYSYQCSPGEYTGETLPKHCSVYIYDPLTLEYSIECDSTGCKKDDRRNQRY
jgi:hypothetical protein